MLGSTIQQTHYTRTQRQIHTKIQIYNTHKHTNTLETKYSNRAFNPGVQTITVVLYVHTETKLCIVTT